MSTYAPEFSQYWLPSRAGAIDEKRTESRDEELRTQQAALEALAERVNAARSIV